MGKAHEQRRVEEVVAAAVRHQQLDDRLEQRVLDQIPQVKLVLRADNDAEELYAREHRHHALRCLGQDL